MDKIIDVYQNNPTIENLYKILRFDIKCNLIITVYKIGKNYYVPSIFLDDALISINQWYTKEPKIENITLGSFEFITYINSKNAYLIYANRELKTSTDVSRLSLTESISSEHPSMPDLVFLPPASFIINYLYKFVITIYIETLSINYQLTHQKNKQERMLCNISHSVRTPLNGILHMTDVISNTKLCKKCSKTEIVESIGYLKQSTLSLSNSMIDIIDLTKMELGKLKTNFKIFDLRDLIYSTTDIISSIGRIIPNVYISPSVPAGLYSDPKFIKQIIVNLLENAVTHTENGSIMLYVDSIEIDCNAEDNNENDISAKFYQLSISVMDTGHGLDEKVKQKIFSPIDMIDDSDGLSLKICRSLAELLNGKLLLDYSDSGGTSFTLQLLISDGILPEKKESTFSILIIDDTSNTTNTLETSTYLTDTSNTNITYANSLEEAVVCYSDIKFDIVISESEITNLNWSNIIVYDNNDALTYKNGIYYVSKKYLYQNFDKIMDTIIYDLSILVVEDEKINRIVIEKILKKLGYKKITIANDGESALEILSHGKYNIALIDIRMPGMSGFELADKIHEAYPEIKMIGVTAQIIDEYKTKPWFCEFIYKPINIEELSKKLS
jgi:signal transduction histidine kinase/CheY-like chemotaxis protein